jgi:hypothetical protein
MLKKYLFGLAAVLFLLAASANVIDAQNPAYRISAPYTYKNLTIFLLHGKDETKKSNILTLQEAMERGVFRVYETSDVNQLEVENISKEFDVFIQSGDIVKGGKQDRVLGVSIIIPARSGRVVIDAFCVESGRWTKRGREDAGQFNSSNDRIVSKELKLAANAARSQQEVWNQVSEAQKKLSKSVGGSVAAADSSSSLQLSLENSRVAASAEEYVKRLIRMADGQRDIIGFAFAVNGEINSADVYASNALFKKLWPKMLKAAAVEALAGRDARNLNSPAPPKPEAVSGFLVDAAKGKAEERKAAGTGRIMTRDKKDSAMFEAVDEKSKTVVHRSYVKKQ